MKRWGPAPPVKFAHDHATPFSESCFEDTARRIIAFIHQREVIEKILTHLGLWPYTAHAPPDAAVA